MLLYTFIMLEIEDSRLIILFALLDLLIMLGLDFWWLLLKDHLWMTKKGLVFMNQTTF